MTAGKGPTWRAWFALALWTGRENDGAQAAPDRRGGPVRRRVVLGGLALLLVGFVFAAWMSRASKASHENVTIAPHIVTAVVPKYFPPYYEWVDGEPQGFAIEVMNELAHRANLRVEYIVKDTWTEVVEAFKAGDAHLIPNMGITPERTRFGKFTAPVETFGISVFVRRTTTPFTDTTDLTGIESADLSGYVVAVVQTNAAARQVAKLPGVEAREFTNLPAAFYALLAGHVDALVYPEPVVWAFAKEVGSEGMIKTVGAPLIEIKRAVFVQPELIDLIARLDRAVHFFVGSEDYARVHEKWFGKPPVYWTPRRILVAVGGAGIAAVILVLLWTNRNLRGLNVSLRAAIAARDEAEAELSINERRYRSLFHDSPVAHLTVDVDEGIILDCNEAATELTGYAMDELRGMTIFALHGDLPEGEEKVRLMYGRSPRAEQVRGEELALRRRDGTAIWVSLSVNSIDDADGNPTEYRAVLTDITVLKRAEDEIRASEGRFEALAESTAVGIFRADAAGACTYVNGAWCRQTGLTPEQAAGQGWCDALHPDDRERVLAEWGAKAAKGEEFAGEFRWRRPDGTDLLVYSQAVPERGGDGEVIGIVGSVTDVTKLKELAADLRASEERFALAMRGANDGLWDWNLVTDEIYFSPRWKGMIGYADDELPNEFNQWERRLHPDDLEATLQSVQAHLRGETATFKVEYRMRHKDGHWVDVLARGFLVHDGGGKPVRFVGTHVDISERKKSERELRRLSEVRETISRCNSALVKITDAQTLFQEMCDILTEVRGYRLAWIGHVENDLAKTVRPVAFAGPAADYLKGVTVRWGDDELGHGPSGMAIRTSQVQVIQDIATNPSFRPWADAARDWSLRTSITLPLKRDDGSVSGVLNVYSSESDAFDDEEVKILKEFSDDLAFGQRTIRTREERNRVQNDLSEALLGTINAIAVTVEKRDPYTAGHQRNVAELAVAIARELGWNEARAEGLRLGAMIHDIGKIYIPAEILNRPGRLSKHEFGMIKSHPEVGHEIVSGVNFPWPVGEMILQHHERMDGSGYPLGLKGEEIVEEARILGVADVVEAITAHRPYRPALGLEVGLDEIRKGRGKIYDPEVVDACISVITEEKFNWDRR